MAPLRPVATEVARPKLPGRLRLAGLLDIGVEKLHQALHHASARPAAHQLGRRGEDLAAWFLHQHGYTIVARNYRAASRSLGGAGEIDLIAFEGVPSTLVFVEVKTRAKHGMVAAEAAVNAAKQRRLQRLAALYRMRRRHCGPYRFDVVVIYGPEDPKPHLTLHRAAFSS